MARFRLSAHLPVHLPGHLVAHLPARFGRRSITAAAAITVGGALVAAAPTAPSRADAGLPHLSISRDYVTGISSGGYMATQLQVAYSSHFSGAGIFSAGPYYCAQDSLVIALEACTDNTAPDDLPALEAYTDDAARSGRIDPTSNLRRQPTWFFHGTKDTVVKTSVANDLARYYRHYGVPLTYRDSVPAGHAWISRLGPNPCGVTQSPYVNSCGDGAVGALLRTMFGSVQPPAATPTGALSRFSQDRYAAPARPGDGDPTRSGAAAIGMGSTGFVYVPTACANGTPCRLVVSLHGCLQTYDNIGTTFVQDSDLNEYADTNRFVVLYPQATPDDTVGNPKGCWDWWGYLGPNDTDYALRSGRQMETVMHMVAALGG